jgi:hypothetical protein
LTFGEIVIDSCPIATAASNVAVTLPRLNPASFFGPIQNPTASAKNTESSGYARSVLISHSLMAFSHFGLWFVRRSSQSYRREVRCYFNPYNLSLLLIGYRAKVVRKLGHF